MHDAESPVPVHAIQSVIPQLFSHLPTVPVLSNGLKVWFTPEHPQLWVLLTVNKSAPVGHPHVVVLVYPTVLTVKIKVSAQTEQKLLAEH